MAVPDKDDPTELVERARAGDQAAWHELVDRYAWLIWAVARDHRLSAADASDVCQLTWLRLAEHLPALERPEKLHAWLVTTARRQSLSLIRSKVSRPDIAVLAEPVDSAEHDVMRGVRDEILWRAVNSLPRRCRLLLRLVAHNPELSYADLGGAIGLAPGSVGPQKHRCLATLRRRVVAAGLTQEAAG
jgi:RNA polymerase sigma factor (sigma-70 family)